MTYTDKKLVCIRDETGYYRTTRKVARNIIASGMTSDDWTYTTKGAWKRNGGKTIPEPVGSD